MVWGFCVYFVYMIPLETDVLRKHRFQKRSQNDVRLRKFESSKFVICLIQREVILGNFVNERFGTAISIVQ